MSRHKKIVQSVTTEDGKIITFEKPVGVWQAIAQAAKANRLNPPS